MQSLHGLPDDALEYQVKSWPTLKRFLAIEPVGTVPDGKTVWPLRKRLR